LYSDQKTINNLLKFNFLLYLFYYVWHFFHAIIQVLSKSHEGKSCCTATSKLKLRFKWGKLAGHPYVAMSNLLDKTHTLTVNNSYARGTSEVLHFPINENDSSNFGGVLQCSMNKLSPGQVRMCCRLASDQFLAATYWRHGNSSSIFHPNLPLGINKVKELICQGADILGIPRNFRPHSLQAVGVTKLANSRGVSDEEHCHTTRHSTVNTSRAYQTVDGRSEASRLLALGVRIPEAPTPPQVESK
jgi:hypothetical protein